MQGGLLPQPVSTILLQYISVFHYRYSSAVRLRTYIAYRYCIWVVRWTITVVTKSTSTKVLHKVVYRKTSNASPRLLLEQYSIGTDESSSAVNHFDGQNR